MIFSLLPVLKERVTLRISLLFANEFVHPVTAVSILTFTVDLSLSAILTAVSCLATHRTANSFF